MSSANVSEPTTGRHKIGVGRGIVIASVWVAFGAIQIGMFYLLHRDPTPIDTTNMTLIDGLVFIAVMFLPSITAAYLTYLLVKRR